VSSMHCPSTRFNIIGQPCKHSFTASSQIAPIPRVGDAPKGVAMSRRSKRSATLVAASLASMMVPSATAFNAATGPEAGARGGRPPPLRSPSPSSASSCFDSGRSPSLQREVAEAAICNEGWVFWPGGRSLSCGSVGHPAHPRMSVFVQS